MFKSHLFSQYQVKQPWHQELMKYAQTSNIVAWNFFYLLLWESPIPCSVVVNIKSVFVMAKQIETNLRFFYSAMFGYQNRLICASYLLCKCKISVPALDYLFMTYRYSPNKKNPAGLI